MDKFGNHRRYDCCIPFYLLCDAEAQGKAEQMNTPVLWMIDAVVSEKCSRRNYNNCVGSKRYSEPVGHFHSSNRVQEHVLQTYHLCPLMLAIARSMLSSLL